MNARSNSFEFNCLGKRINEIVSAIFHSVIFNRCFGKFQYNQENYYSIGTLGFEEVICDFLDFTYVRVTSFELTKVINQHIKTFVDELRLLSSNNIRLQQQQRRQQQKNIRHSPSIPSFTNVANNNNAFRRPSSLFNMMEQNDPFMIQLPIISSTSSLTSPNTNNVNLNNRRFSHYHQDLQLLPTATGSISLEFSLKNKSRTFPFAGNDSIVWEVWTLKINCLKDDANESFFNKKPIEDQLFDEILSIVSIVNNSNAFLPPMPTESELENVFDTSYPDVQPYNFKISYKIGKESNETRGRSSGGTLSEKGGLLGHGEERLRKLFEKLSL